MKKTLLAACVMFLTMGAFAQVKDLGGPISWRGKLPAHIVIPKHTMPGFDMEAKRIEDSINDLTKDQPWQFGYKYDTDITTQNSGVWTDLPNGNRLWRTAIECPGALTVNLLFEDFDLPAGAHIYVYDVNETNRVGAYTSINNRPDGFMGTEIIHGEEVIVEYYEPASVQGQGSFTISNVVHGYRSLGPIQKDLAKALNSSGACNIDVNCPLGNGWEDQIRSVAMIVVSGSGICSGALINNTCNDGTPYFLTANHCLSGATVGQTLNWAFRFNWESPPGTEICAQNGNSVDPGAPYDQTAYGATILVQGTQADHALLMIDNMTLADAQGWNLFYAGWNNDDTDGSITQGTGIHHPSGDVKKICREDNSPYHSTASGAQVWWIDSWDQGVTEPGSSGSPLFDQNHRIIGQLYGGAAACSGTNNNGQYDYFGRLGVSWSLGISNYLAPAACGSSTANDGWDPNQPTAPDDAGILAIISPSGLYCTDNFDPEVTLRNYGTNDLTSVDIMYDIDGGAPSTYNWSGTLTPGSSVNVTLPNMTTTGGAHTFNAWTANPNATTDSDPANDDASSNYTATIGGLPLNVSITTDCWGYETYWEIVDAGMSVVASGGNSDLVLPGGDQTANSGGTGAYGNQTTVNTNLCLAAGCYDFVIYDDWGDGLEGTTSGCGTDGSYSLTDGGGNTLISIQSVNFGNNETQNFCLQNPCNSTFATNEDPCGTLDVTFLTGNSTNATYDIGSGSQSTGTFTGLTAGTYTVTIVDGDACTSMITVDVNGALAGSVTTVTHETTGGDGAIDITTTGGGTITYSWTGPNGYTSSVEDPSGLVAGNYTVVITDDCGGSVTLNATVEDHTGIGEIGTIDFVIYPNPSNGHFNIQFIDYTVEEYNVTVSDVAGRIVYTATGSTTTYNVDLSNVADGTYMLKISTNDLNTTKTIVVKK